MIKSVQSNLTTEVDKFKYIGTQDKKKAAIGAALGTIIPVVIMAKERKIKNPFKLKYSATDMVILSATSIGGGTAAGILAESGTEQKNRCKEGIFQFLNATVPIGLVSLGLKACEKIKPLNNIGGKIGATAVGVAAGMIGATKLYNKIVDPKNKEPDRKLTLKDCVVSADDVVGALTIARFPCIEALHLDAILPVVFGYCGYRAGVFSKKDKQV